MKKAVCFLLALGMGLLCCCALAEQKVRLPESGYRLTLPDGMEYDGPGKTLNAKDDAWFVYASKKLGLEVQFFCYENGEGATLEYLAKALAENSKDIAIQRISGVDMIVYRVTDPDDPPESGMKCIGYVLTEGNMIQEICFWYANQAAADLTAEIISSITDKD